jgi:hypothetical protein
LRGLASPALGWRAADVAFDIGTEVFLSVVVAEAEAAVSDVEANLSFFDFTVTACAEGLRLYAVLLLWPFSQKPLVASFG